MTNQDLMAEASSCDARSTSQKLSELRESPRERLTTNLRESTSSSTSTKVGPPSPTRIDTPTASVVDRFFFNHVGDLRSNKTDRSKEEVRKV